MAPPRGSLLTQGLEGLAPKSATIKRMLDELYALDDTLQDTHQQAQRDDEYGEHVVQAYQAFLAYREQFIQQLQREQVAVPWHLRMKIDDLELTLRQRKQKQEEDAGSAVRSPREGEKHTTTCSGSTESKAPAAADTGAGKEDEKETDPLLMLKAMIIPSLLMLLVALATYFAADARQ